MKAFLKNSLFVVILFSLTSSIGFVAEYPYIYFPRNDTVCDDTRPYMVGFFNGAGNDQDAAKRNMEALRKLYGDVQYGLPVEYALFYNQTKGYRRDLLEIYAQKYEEMGLSVNGDQSFSELFFYINELSNGDNATLPDDELSKVILELIKKTPEVKDFIIEMERMGATELVEYLGKMAKEEYNTVTVEDYKNHIKQLETLLDDDYKVILIGHSQGTLFVNHVYNKVVGDEDSSHHKMQGYVMPYYVAPVVAPEKLFLFGFYNLIFSLQDFEYIFDPEYDNYFNREGLKWDGRIDADKIYVLSSNDMVIKLLDLNTPLPNVNGKGDDFMNHSLIETYLKEGTEMRKAMEDFQQAFLIMKIKTASINFKKILFSIELEKLTDSTERVIERLIIDETSRPPNTGTFTPCEGSYPINREESFNRSFYDYKCLNGAFHFNYGSPLFGRSMSYVSNGCIITKDGYDNLTYPSVIGIGFYISRYTCLPEQLDYCSVPPAKAVLRIRNSKNELLVEKQLEFDAEVPYNEPTLSSYVAPIGKIKVHQRKKPNDNLTFDVEFDENI